VLFAPGPGRTTADFVVVPADQLASTAGGGTVRGLSGEYFDNPRLEGPPRLTRTDTRMSFQWTLNSPGRGIPFDWYSVRWTGTITVPPAVPAGTVTHIGVEGNDGYRLWLDGALVIDKWIKQSYSTTTAPLSLASGSTHQIKLEYFEPAGNARVKLVWDVGVEDDAKARIDYAVSVAKTMRAVVIVAGVEEGEFRDRARLALPGRQEELIKAVAATGVPTIVVLIGGSAITMSPWIDQVSAVVDAWYPGEDGGDAVADVLFGDYNPAGRLPVTFPVSEGQLPLYYDHKPTGRGDDYVDLTGQPLFPFGFGLSYTTFDYSALTITPAEIGPAATSTIQCSVTNTGSRAGDEVVQLYIRDVLASVARPVIELKRFERVHLAPGEKKTLTFTIGPDDLRMLDKNMKWIVEPGTFRILIGASSRDLRLRGDLVVK
jgi:beta-glucosidase